MYKRKVEELNHHLKADAKRYIAKNNIQLYTINAIDLAIKIGMGTVSYTHLSGCGSTVRSSSRIRGSSGAPSDASCFSPQPDTKSVSAAKSCLLYTSRCV